MGSFSSRLREFLSSRYGMDKLNIFLIVSGMVLSLVLGFAFPKTLWSYLSLIPLFLAAWRMISRDIAARAKENDGFTAIFRKPAAFVGFYSEAWKNRKTHKYFRCPKCRGTTRVPKGKGKLKIRCPHCGETFVRRS